MFADLSFYKSYSFENRQLLDVVFGNRKDFDNVIANVDTSKFQIEESYNEEQKRCILNAINVI